MATISAAMSTTPFVRGRPSGAPIGGMPPSQAACNIETLRCYEPDRPAAEGTP
jgi:hypothetical protein